jgi:UTP-glucose-1-phosphate uridylyltransferase
MTGNQRPRVVVAAGGLGTCVAGWSRYLPKEFLPVAGRPGIVHILEEISALGARSCPARSWRAASASSGCAARCSR